MATRTFAAPNPAALNASIPDADATTKGKVQLAGDLGGTAASPTVPGLADKANALTTTTTKTSSYTAGPWQVVPCDATGGGFTVTLSAASVSGQVVVIKKLDTSSNAITVQRSGIDVINVATISVQLTTQNQTIRLVSNGAGVWTAEADGLPLAGLDSRYLRAANNLSDLANAATARTNLGAGAASGLATLDGSGAVPASQLGNADSRYLRPANNLSDLANVATARTNLGAGATSGLATLDGSGAVPASQLGNADSRYLRALNNLSDLTNYVAARTNLGAGTASGLATLDSSASVPLSQLGNAESRYMHQAWNWINVMEGATPATRDGSTSDHTAINATIAASAVGSTIYFPGPGTYLLDATTAASGLKYGILALGGRKYVAGRGAKIKVKSGANLDAIFVSPAALTTGTGNNLDAPIQVYGLNIDGNIGATTSTNQTGGLGDGIVLGAGGDNDGNRTIIENCNVVQLRGHGIVLTEVTSDGNTLGFNASTSPTAVEPRVVNNTVENVGGRGIWQKHSAANTMTDAFYDGNIVGYTRLDGLRVDSAAGSVITKNHIYAAGLTGIYAQWGYASRVYGNYVEGIGSLGLTPNGSIPVLDGLPTWSSATTYTLNQTVLYDASDSKGSQVYISKSDGNTNHTPSTSGSNWTLYAGGRKVACYAAYNGNSGRTIQFDLNHGSLGHTSGVLHTGLSYIGLYLQGSAGSVNHSAYVGVNDIANELVVSNFSNATAYQYEMGTGSGGLEVIEPIQTPPRGNWGTARSVQAGVTISTALTARADIVSTTKTANYTATTGTIDPVDATAGAVTVTLPSATLVTIGQTVIIKKVDSSVNPVTVQRAGSDTINTSATAVTLTLQNQSVVLVSTGGGAWLVKSNDLPLGGLDSRYDARYAQLASAPTFTGEVTATDVKVTGTTGAPNSGRFVGVTASGAPTSGTYAVGDFVVTQNGQMFVCVGAGTPGTWVTPMDTRNLLTTGQETITRELATSNTGLTLSSGNLKMIYFTGRKSETTTQVRIYAGSTAVTPGQTTLLKIGLWTLNGSGNGTLVASTASDTALLNVANTGYSKSWQSSYGMVAGQRYAFGVLAVHTMGSPPTLLAQNLPINPVTGDSPQLGGLITGLSDLGDFVAGSVSAQGARPYGAIIP